MKVVWVSFAPLEKTPRGLTAKLASARYRMLIPASVLEGSKVTHLPPGANRRTLMERFRGADAVVLGKFFSGDAGQALDLVASLKDAGVPVLADYSDDHFSKPVLGDAYCALANTVDRVVASTPGLAEVIARYSSTPVSVVTDPVEGTQGEPRAPAGQPLRLLWFGHPTNLDTLQYALPALHGLAVSVTLVTAPGTGAEQLGARFRPWSVQAVFDELRQCDAVIIPSNPHDPRKAVKSPNRFTESLWAGRFVLAHPLPAYQELADCGWVGEDLAEGARWLAAHGEEALQRVRRGQQVVAERFSPRAVGAAWRAAIESAARR
jgi:hypothetical protein